MLARSTVDAVSVEIRSITADDVLAFRRAIRNGFHTAEVVDDEQFARDMSEPLDRHYVAVAGSEFVATFGSFPTELTLPGGATVPAGAVTQVTCRATHRRQGILSRIMERDLIGSRDRGEVADVLIAAEYPIYGRFGYGPAARGTEREIEAALASPTYAGEGTIQVVDGSTFRKEAPRVFDRVRTSRPAMIDRGPFDWDMRSDVRRQPEGKPWRGFRLLCADSAGTIQGYARYTVEDRWRDMRPQMTVDVVELAATTPAAEARLWAYLLSLDLVATIKAHDRPVDDTLPWLLVDGRHARQTSCFDMLWLRPLDVGRLLMARAYDTTGRVVMEVDDPLGLAGGRFALDASPDGATCTTTTESADVTLPIRTLGAACLGDVRLDVLHRAGWLDEHVPGGVARAAGLLAGSVAPWCNTWF
jgi:predicted acetyltransferase